MMRNPGDRESGVEVPFLDPRLLIPGPVALLFVRCRARIRAFTTHDLRFTTYDPTDVANPSPGPGMTHA